MTRTRWILLAVAVVALAVALALYIVPALVYIELVRPLGGS